MASNFTNHEFSAERLVIAGKLAHARGDCTQAAFLLSAGASVRSGSGYLFGSLAHQEFELATQECQRVLDPETWTIVWQGGQTASEEDALVRAMEYLREVVNGQIHRERVI